MKAKWICLLFVSSVFRIAFCGTELIDPYFHKEMKYGIDLIMRQEYDSASFVFNQMVLKKKDYPAGYFMQATLIVTRFYDKNDTSSLKGFYPLTARIIELTSDKEDPIFRFYRGATFAYLSVFLSKDGRWMSGAMNGKKAADIFKKMVAENIKSGDALGMLGSYHYWSSAVMKKFIWLPFIQDRREQGIMEMSIGLKKAEYLRFALLNSLLWVYYDNARYSDALLLCQEALKDYPQNRVFRLIEMHILYKEKNYAASLEDVVRLQKAYKNIEEVPVNYTAIKIKKAIIFYSMGRKKEADVITEEVKRSKYGGYLKSRLEKDFAILEKSRY